jgi:hypothetical protein
MLRCIRFQSGVVWHRLSVTSVFVRDTSTLNDNTYIHRSSSCCFPCDSYFCILVQPWLLPLDNFEWLQTTPDQSQTFQIIPKKYSEFNSWEIVPDLSPVWLFVFQVFNLVWFEHWISVTIMFVRDNSALVSSHISTVLPSVTIQATVWTSYSCGIMCAPFSFVCAWFGSFSFIAVRGFVLGGDLEGISCELERAFSVIFSVQFALCHDLCVVTCC